MYASNTTARNNDTLVHVTFERESPLASTPTIEVVFKVEDGGTMTISRTKVLVLLSCTVTRHRRGSLVYGRWNDLKIFFTWAESNYGPGLTIIQAASLYPLYQIGHC